MSINRSDPRLTAYALGEMNETERKAFEAEMDAAARAEVEAIRKAAELVHAELASEAMPELRPVQRRTVTAAAQRLGPRPWKWVAAAAALVTVSLSAYFVFAPGITGASEATPATLQAQAERQLLESAARSMGFSDPRQQTAAELGTVRLKNTLADVDELASRIGGTPPSGSDNFYMGVARDPGGGRGRRGPADVLPRPAGPGTAGPRTAGPTSGGRRGAPLPGVGSGGLLAPPPEEEPFNTEGYDRIRENPFLDVAVENTSTFSVDVDTASYANVRRFLEQDQLPPPDAVRIEEMINYFQYEYEAPGTDAEHPFRAHVEIASSPWNAGHRLARIALKGKVIPFENRPPMNLVFLIDVSGSMRAPNKLPLVKQSMKKLVGELGPTDQVAIAVYAGAAGLVLPTTPSDQGEKILAAIDKLEAGGSTNGGQGIQLAYDTAAQHLIRGGVNRVILATDGDFNVGISDRGSLLRMIEERAKTGVFLSVLGFGMGNYKDDLLEQLSNSGNGNYAYIDSFDEACRVLVDGLGGTLIAIAKDVKVQIFFNPAHVAGYRLIGYENRLLQKQDFNDDTKDAGEIGVGHSVTALYELVPAGVPMPGPAVDENPFVGKPEGPPIAGSDAWFRLRMRYKEPEGETSELMEEDAADGGLTFDKASEDFQWAAAVAGFGMLLRKSEHAGNITLDGVLEIAESNLGADEDGSRDQFLGLVQRAREIWNR